MEKQYPSWRYHATEKARIVQSAESEAALGEGWHQSPADAAAAPVPVPVPVPEPELAPEPEEIDTAARKKQNKR